MVETSKVYGGSRHAPPPSSPAQLTVRGAIIALLLTTLLGTLVGELFAVTWLTGALFVIGTLTVIGLVRAGDLHLLVVAPPLIYFVALLIVEALVSLGGGFLQSLVVGIAGNLSAIAPWLLIGTAAAVALAWYRGLPAAYTAFRTRLRATDEPTAAPAGLPPEAPRAADPARRSPAASPRPRPDGPRPDGPQPGDGPESGGRPGSPRPGVERSEPGAAPRPAPPRLVQPAARYTTAPSHAPAQTPMTPRYANAPNGYQRRPGRHSGS